MKNTNQKIILNGDIFNIIISCALLLIIILMNGVHSVETKALQGNIELLSSKIDSLKISGLLIPTPILKSSSTVKDAIAPTIRELNIPEDADGSFKTYLNYKHITDRSSKQWKLQQFATTNEKGLRCYKGCYLVAMGSYYAKSIGQKLNISFDTGITILVMIGDFKSDLHTDPKHMFVPVNGNIVEFIVDISVMDAGILKCGDVSGLGFKGKIIKIVEVPGE
jgi:hypothetical protein